MEYAPVMIPTLSRYEHFRRCLDSLSRCTFAECTEVYIGLDYPPSKKYFDGYMKIVTFLENCGDMNFKKIHVIRHPRNIGPVANWQFLQDFLFSKYEVVCCSEDDNEFAPNFLVYINEGLEQFKHDSNIFAICGYNFPIDMSGYENNFYYSQVMSAWGYATWRDRYNTILNEIKQPSFLSNYYRRNKLSCLLTHRFRLLNNLSYFAKGVYEDTFVSLCLYSQKKFVIAPTISKVRNWGHDGSGVNSTVSHFRDYLGQQIDIDRYFTFDSCVLQYTNPILESRLDEYFDCTIKTKFRRVLMLAVLKMFLILQK